MHNFNVAIVYCSCICQLLKVTIIRLYTRNIKRKLFYIYIYVFLGLIYMY